MFALEAHNCDVLTIEGQANDDGSLNKIQQAFKENHGLQCGFCTPGMVMAAADLLKTNSKPTELEIREHLEGNICRCTGYHNIVKAILAASGQDISRIPTRIVNLYNFEFKQPKTISEALAALESDEAQILAGGQTLIPAMKQRLASPSMIL